MAGAYHPGQTRKRVYFPQTHPGDRTLYIRVSQDPAAKAQVFTAGSTAEVEIPLNEFAIFARAGTVLPIGKDLATVTALQGIARTAVDGVEVVLKEDGGVVSLDDWRGVEIYPPTGSEDDSFVGQGTWIEDDGVSRFPKTSIVRVEYRGDSECVKVTAKFLKRDFNVAWGNDVWVILPPGDDRRVQDATEGKDAHGRRSWKIRVV